MDIITLLIQLVSGALGGNIAGSALKNMSLGTLGNTIAGIVGGGVGGQILDYAFHAPAVGGGPLDWAAILTQVVGGGLGEVTVLGVHGVSGGGRGHAGCRRVGRAARGRVDRNLAAV